MLERQIYRCWFLGAQETAKFFEKEQDTEIETMKEQVVTITNKKKKTVKKRKTKKIKAGLQKSGEKKQIYYKVQ